MTSYQFILVNNEFKNKYVYQYKLYYFDNEVYFYVVEKFRKTTRHFLLKKEKDGFTTIHHHLKNMAPANVKLSHYQKFRHSDALETLMSQ